MFELTWPLIWGVTLNLAAAGCVVAVGLAIDASAWLVGLVAGVVWLTQLALGHRESAPLPAPVDGAAAPGQRMFAQSAAARRQMEQLTADLAETIETQRASAEVLRVIGDSAFDLDPVFKTVVENASKLCGADAGQIFMTDGGFYRLRASFGVSPSYRELLERNPIAPGRGTLVGRVALEQRMVQIADVLSDATYQWEEAQRAGSFRTIIGVPMLADEEVIGVLSLWRQEVEPFTKRQIDLLTTLAAEGAIAIHNARLVQQLEEKSRQLEVAGQHKSDFLASMSHDLRTPLNAVIGFSDVLLEEMFGGLNEKQRDYVQDIHGAGRHLLELVNDILDLSKVEAGQMVLDIRPFSLVAALEASLTMVRDRASQKGIALTLEVDSELDEIDGDELRIQQVMENLLTNAVKFTPAGGQVAVSARQRDGETEVCVTDTGIGIAEADCERIFESFQQGGRGKNNQEIEGTGLGLTLCKRIVELHGGRIGVESEVHHGSRFTFVLPVHQPNGSSSVAPADRPVTEPG
jgi:signal transduction histidine kinase